jgi:hypothetical protein
VRENLEFKDSVEAGVVREMHTDISPSMAGKKRHGGSSLLAQPPKLTTSCHNYIHHKSIARPNLEVS